MKAAGELAGVAAVRPADLHAAMAAGIQKCPDRPAGAAADKDGILAHIGSHVIARLGDLAFMSQEKPTARKDSLELRCVDLGIEENLAADEPFVELDVLL